MIDFLIGVMVLVSLWQPTIARAQAAIAFSFITAAHCLLLSDLPGYWYYIVSASADMMIVTVLAALPVLTDLTIALMRLSIFSLIANAAGWVFYMLYLPPDGYNLVFFGLYTAAIWLLLRKDRDDVGIYSVGRRHPGLRSAGSSSGLSFHKGGKTT